MSYVSVGGVGHRRRRHSGLSGTGSETLSFDDAVSVARNAMSRLYVLGQALYHGATDEAHANIGFQAMEFASKGGTAGLDKAASTKSVAKLQEIAGMTAQITSLAVDELEDAVIERFFTMNILPPSVSGQVREAVNNAAAPALPGGKPGEIPVWVPIAAGLAGLVALGYFIRSIR